MTMKIDLPYLMPDTDRHGNPRLYVRRDGRKVRLKETPGTPEFNTAYNAALEKLTKPKSTAPTKLTIAKRGTLGWLAAKYFDSDEFESLDTDSQSTRRGVIEECLREPRRLDAPQDLMRDCPLSAFGTKQVKMLRDRKKGQGLKGAANNRRKHLSAMCSWAIENDEGLSANPVRDVKRVQYASDGYHTWDIGEVAQFATRHPIGTKAHLALGLLLFLGARPSDTAKFGRQMVKNGSLGFTPSKTRKKRAEKSYKPILPILQRIIDASPCGDLTYIVTEYGKPFSDKGFGNKMRQWCDEANLHHCTAHGLRKAGATILAEKGATAPQLMAIYDWSTLSVAEDYIRKANRKKMTAETLPLLAMGME